MIKRPRPAPNPSTPGPLSCPFPAHSQSGSFATCVSTAHAAAPGAVSTDPAPVAPQADTGTLRLAGTLGNTSIYGPRQGGRSPG